MFGSICVGFGRKAPLDSYSGIPVSAVVSALACVDLSLIGLAWVVVVFGVPCVLAPVCRIPLREEFVRREEELEEETVKGRGKVWFWVSCVGTGVVVKLSLSSVSLFCLCLERPDGPRDIVVSSFSALADSRALIGPIQLFPSCKLLSVIDGTPELVLC